MKDILLGLVITLALIVVFSVFGGDRDALPPRGVIGFRYPGDSGTIVPGGGDGFVEINYQPGSTEESEGRGGETSSETQPEIRSETITIEAEGEENSMNDLLIMYWHGVATVLIGETVALMVAIAWMKIRMKFGDNHAA